MVNEWMNEWTVWCCQETVSVEMQKYSDVINELKASQELCEQLESRCTEKSTQLEQTNVAMEEKQQAFDVALLYIVI